jgi:hypothetical protein
VTLTPGLWNESRITSLVLGYETPDALENDALLFWHSLDDVTLDVLLQVKDDDDDDDDKAFSSSSTKKKNSCTRNIAHDKGSAKVK